MGKSYISPFGVSINPKKIFGSPNGLAQHFDKGYIGDENGIARMVYGETIPPEPPGPAKTYLIQNGVLVNETLTGNWEAVSADNLSWNEPRKPNIAFSDGYMTVSQSQYYNGQDIGYEGYYQTKNAIDLSGYSKLIIEGYSDGTSRGAGGSICVMKSSIAEYDKYTAMNKIIRQEFALNIDTITASRKIGIRCVGYGTRYHKTVNVFVYNLWLE